MLLILLNIIYKPVKAYRCVRTSVRDYTSIGAPFASLINPFLRFCTKI